MIKFKIKFIFFIVLCFIFTVSYALSAKELIDKALEEKKPKFQLILLTKAIDIAKDDSSFLHLALYNRGVLFFKQNKYLQAIQDFEQALKLKPEDIDLLKNAGLAYDRISQYKNALNKFESIILLLPESRIGYFNRANVNFHRKLYSKAIKDYSYILETYSFDIDTRSNRGWAYFHLKLYSQALNDFDHILLLKPEHKEALEGKRQIKKILDNL